MTTFVSVGNISFNSTNVVVYFKVCHHKESVLCEYEAGAIAAGTGLNLEPCLKGISFLRDSSVGS